MKNFQARGSAKYIVAMAAVGLLTSTPGMAVIPHDFGKVAEALTPGPQPQFAPIETIAPVEAEAEPALEHLGDGTASYYGHELAGNRTASGERFNPKALTAAHRTLPLGTKLKVTNKTNGKSVIVRVNDRGPFVKKRLIDLSLGAAQQISMVGAGHAAVRLELLR
jgi:rare lipoprotein A